MFFLSSSSFRVLPFVRVSFSNSNLFSPGGINGVSYDSLNDSPNNPYSRIITLRGPVTVSPGSEWAMVKGIAKNETSLYNVVNVLSTSGKGNLIMDTENNIGDLDEFMAESREGERREALTPGARKFAKSAQDNKERNSENNKIMFFHT